MPGAKLVVLYPTPTDAAAFEHAYANEHIPLAAPVFQSAGATKAVLTKSTAAPAGTPAYYRMAEIHFPSLSHLQACASSKAGQDVLADAHRISTGGAPIVFIAEEEAVTF